MTVQVAEIAFFTFLLIHLIKTLHVAWPLMHYKIPDVPACNYPLSIIVCAHNEYHNLVNGIPAILNQSHDRFELIVVLDRCTDESQVYLNSLADHRLKLIVQHDLPHGWDGKKYALRQAIDAAQHEWLVLTDADCVPASINWLSSLTRNINDEIEIILGISPYDNFQSLLSLIVQYETFQTALHYLSAALRKSAYMGVGRNIAYKKSLFNESGDLEGIKHITGGDDDLMVQRMANGTNVGINIGMESLTYSVPKRTWKEYLSQKTRHLSVGKYYKSKFKREHTFRTCIHTGLWLSFLYLISFSNYPWRIIVAYGLLVLIKGLFFNIIASRSGLPLKLRWYPLMDFIYAVFLPLMAIRAMLERNIRWKK